MYATLPAAAPVAVGRVRTPGPRSNAPMNPVKAAVPPALGGRALADEALAGPVPGSGLRGRRGECEALDRLVADVEAGQGQVLVLRGEAGAGKTALLEYLLERASGCCRARTAGVESEMELAFAGLHQLCAPFLDRIERLPGPQREALSTAFNLRDGATPDRFAVGLAVLSLLSEVAGERPLVWVVDDAHWLDRASAQALTFVARRLADKPAAVVFAVREPGGEPGAGGTRRARGGQDSATGSSGRVGLGLPGGARGRGAVGDGTGVRRVASAVRADAGSPGGDTGAAA